MNKTRQTTWNSAHVGQASRLPVQGASLPRDRVAKSAAASCLLAVALGSSAASTDQDASARFRKEVQPLLVEYCYDCHGESMSKGNLAFDSFKSDQELLARRDLWWAVLKNVRAGLMPPAKKPRPSDKQRQVLATWIKTAVFGIDPRDPDPGRVTIRRLNRVEYRNTLRDLMGFDFKVEDELPPDDSGYGFDNIGDVLTLSPMLLEKYMQAAETIAAAAVPRATWVVAEETIPGSAFRSSDGRRNGERLGFYQTARLTHSFEAPHPGQYRLELELEVLGQFDFDPGRCRVRLSEDHQELLSEEFGWQNGKKFRFEFERNWGTGQHQLALELNPLTPLEQKKNSLDLRLRSLRVKGPFEKKFWVRPKSFDLFFSQDPPEAPAERHGYTREVVGRFAKKAFRRPVDEPTIDRLVQVAEEVCRRPGKRFEDGIAQALVPVLATPRFLFRVEDVEPNGGAHPLVDEYSLASRLSYFLWSTTPDAELMRLADHHVLRQHLGAQVARMLADARTQQGLIENFVGQWLQVRDVEGIEIDARAVRARDTGEDREFERRRLRFQELRAIPEEKLTPEQRAEIQRMIEQRRERLKNKQDMELDRDLRRALREETERCFAYVMRENRSVLELLDSDYTFLNERLARYYGITNVTGTDMRRVTLPPESPRGGVLTEGSMLIVTSNPTRTSPVKRGLFILDNILGTPPPPPPANVPPLEASEKEFGGREPTLKELLELHRSKPLCSSCHSRMDPLGLALENFNALGLWRDQERRQPIDVAGKFITGETFQTVRDLKHVLVTSHRLEFYRCLTEKLLTYALGRGLEDYDVETVDRIVDRLDKENGRFSALLMGLIDSAPFQKRRDQSAPAQPAPARTIEQRTEIRRQP